MSSVVISNHTSRLVPQILQRLEDRLQMGGGRLPVELLREALEVHVGGVHLRVEIRAWGRVYVPGRHRHGVDAAFVTSIRHVHRVLREDDRIVVGKRNARRPRALGGTRNLASGVADSLVRSWSRDFEMSQFWQNRQPRLQPAVPNDSTLRAGVELVQRFLLDQFDAEPTTPVRRQHHAIAHPFAHKAPSALAVVERAVSRAQVALQTPIVAQMPISPRIQLAHSSCSSVNARSCHSMAV